MTTAMELGEKLLKEAGWIFEKDLKIAVEEENYNIAVRRAQEVVELAIKGYLRMLGIDYPKVHDAGYIFSIEASKMLPFKESSLREIERISKWLAEARAPSVQKTNGTCAICGASFSKTAMKKHLESCIQKYSFRKPSGYPVPVETTLFTVLAEGSFFHEYWMYFEVPASSMLKKLDNFLRDTWVECCWHLSQFIIEDRRYISELDEYFKDMNDKSMNYTLEKVLSVGNKFSYEYDFGSPTHLNLKVISVREVEDSDSTVSLLARNEAPRVTCTSCGKIATHICRQCGCTGEGWVCDDCAPEHECGEELLLPVVNSPRVGVCGYTGKD